VSFRVSAQVRERLEREAAALGLSVNELARRRTCAQPETAQDRVDIAKNAGGARGRGDLQVEYDDEVVSE
jgi:hypothetical protein